MQGLAHGKQRRHWLDEAVLAVLSDGTRRTVAQVRDALDALGDGADATMQEFRAQRLRTRTQAVRRSLRRLARAGALNQDMGPGEIGDVVERFRGSAQAPGIDMDREVASLRLELAQAGLRHEAQLLRLRQLLAVLCAHLEPEPDTCLACKAFVEAGGRADTKAGDAQDLAESLTQNGAVTL